MTPNPDPNTAWQVVLTLAVLLAIAVNVFALYRTGRPQKIEPQPLDVRKIPGVVSLDIHNACHGEVKRRLDGHDGDIRAIYSELKCDRERVEANASSRSAGIYHKVDEVRIELSDKIEDLVQRVASTTAQAELTTQQVSQINAKLDRAIERRTT